MTEVVAGGHWSCSSGGDVYIGVLEIIIRYLVIITGVLCSAPSVSQSVFTITEKALVSTFLSHLRHY